MTEQLRNFARGKILLGGNTSRTWLILGGIIACGVIMIASSHSMERKVHKIASLRDEVREMRSRYAEAHQELTELRVESNVARTLKAKGILPASGPPYKLVVSSNATDDEQ